MDTRTDERTSLYGITCWYMYMTESGINDETWLKKYPNLSECDRREMCRIVTRNSIEDMFVISWHNIEREIAKYDYTIQDWINESKRIYGE